MKKIYGWQEGDAWFLSRRPKKEMGPRNRYESQLDAVQDAERRGLEIEWQS